MCATKILKPEADNPSNIIDNSATQMRVANKPIENKIQMPMNNKELPIARTLTEHMPAFQEMFVALPNKKTTTSKHTLPRG